MTTSILFNLSARILPFGTLRQNFCLVLYYVIYFSVHYLKRPGAVLDSGSIVANLVLDDPTRVVQVIYLSVYKLIQVFQLNPESKLSVTELNMQVQFLAIQSLTTQMYCKIHSKCLNLFGNILFYSLVCIYSCVFILNEGQAMSR